MRIKPTEQIYENYTPEDFAVWKKLFQRQMVNLNKYACGYYLDALDVIGFSADKIPDFTEVNTILMPLTGWRLIVAKELVPNEIFFSLLADRIFPATCWLRSMEELDYIEEPDMFHDVYGHIPLLTHPDYADFMASLGRIALRHIHEPDIINLLSRVYWYTIEFGMITEEGKSKAFGAGIMSSVSEIVHSIGNQSRKKSFDIHDMIHLPYRTDILQPVYFVIDSYEHLIRSSGEIEKALEAVQSGMVKMGFNDC